MRWTITYFLMICSLVATVCALMCDSTDLWSVFYPRSEKALGSVALAEREMPCIVKKPGPITQVLATQPAPVQPASMLEIEAGATRQQVLARLGPPSATTKNNWMYGTQMMVFKDDRVAGVVQIDPEHAMRNLETAFQQAASFAPAPQSTPKKKRAARPSTVAKSRGYRSTKSTTLWEPMYRKFYSDTPLPRSQRHWTRTNGLPGYRDHRYTRSNAIYQR